tara:strand:- start:16 stop:264 length:249 start_codon:yes stop_codon:yes gene_type:complete
MIPNVPIFGDVFNEILRPWSGPTFVESYRESLRPAEGAIREMTESKTVTVKCEYPDPDDGVSYSWIKVDGLPIRPEITNGDD